MAKVLVLYPQETSAVNTYLYLTGQQEVTILHYGKEEHYRDRRINWRIRSF